MSLVVSTSLFSPVRPTLGEIAEIEAFDSGGTQSLVELGEPAIKPLTPDLTVSAFGCAFIIVVGCWFVSLSRRA